MRILTQRQIDARMEAYEQAATSLEGNWFDSPEECEQGKIVAAKIRAIAAKWHSSIKQ